jgi:holo-[acyl-carrier protein] synthase
VIIGTGVDMIEIARIAAAAQNPRFRERVYTPRELAESGAAGHRLAGFFAAKEALLKAMGTGLSSFSWREMEIGHDALGAPRFAVNGKIQDFLAAKGVARIHLSISHSREYAIAQVVLEEGG